MARYGVDFSAKSNNFARSHLCKVPERGSDDSDRYWRSRLCKVLERWSDDSDRYLNKITDINMNH
jgi:hypothetical protein